MFGGGMFGQNKPQAAPPSSGSSLFGGAQAPAAGQESKAPTPLSFGSAANTAAPAAGAAAGGSLFAGLGSKDASKPSSGASTPQANKTAPSASFTPAGNPPTANLFGGAAGAKPAAGLFGGLGGQPPKADENKAPATGAGDAQPKSGTQFGGFGNLGGGAGGASATPLFGEKKTEAGKDAQPTTEKPAEAAKPSMFSNAFGKKPEATTASPAPGSTSNLFGGVGTTSSSSAQPATTTATSGAATGGSMFGGGATSAAKPAEATPQAAPANAGGASLFGKPAAEKPATQQAQQPAQAAEPTSRLVGKSLDEILTSWSTSLATHQSRFAKLADQVGAWDRELTSNSTSISKLYSRCFQAERDVAEVERQLSTVEQGQRELGSRLDKYEAEVDGLLEQAGLGDAGGVDRERETTYKAAEACSDRLMEMNQSLTAMIEGINDASTKLSSSSVSSGKAAKDAGEDPLSQIVRVLNSHLAQLQVIDSGAADLSKRVEAAQVDVGVAGSRLGASMRGSTMGGGGGNEVAEGFKKSFFRSGDRY
jgi:nuclear pore complex protein Nup62